MISSVYRCQHPFLYVARKTHSSCDELAFISEISKHRDIPNEGGNKTEYLETLDPVYVVRSAEVDGAKHECSKKYPVRDYRYTSPEVDSAVRCNAENFVQPYSILVRASGRETSMNKWATMKYLQS